MDFQIRKDAREWFKNIKKPYYELDFDLYYLCLMASFAAGGRKKLEITSEQVADLVGYFPEKYKFQSKLIIGLLIHTELRHLCIDLSERDEVYKQVKRIVEPDSPSYLSNEGMRLMNQYAHGGFDVLCENFSERPRNIETFIRKYFLYLQELSNNRQN